MLKGPKSILLQSTHIGSTYFVYEANFIFMIFFSFFDELKNNVSIGLRVENEKLKDVFFKCLC